MYTGSWRLLFRCRTGLSGGLKKGYIVRSQGKSFSLCFQCLGPGKGFKDLCKQRGCKGLGLKDYRQNL